MKKLLKTSEKILFGLAFMGDLAIEVYTRGHGFGTKKSLVDALNIKNSTFRVELNRFLRTGNIEKIVDNKGRVCYRLTPPGISKFERIFPLYELSRKPWDNKWRVVIFDINEKKRNQRNNLRFKLVSLGFGMLQKSVYISPLDVLGDFQEYLKTTSISNNAFCFEARQVFSSNPREMAAFVWNLKKLNQQYLELINKIENNNFDKKSASFLKNEYFEILLNDPMLPVELLPEEWVGGKARRMMMKM